MMLYQFHHRSPCQEHPFVEEFFVESTRSCNGRVGVLSNYVALNLAK